MVRVRVRVVAMVRVGVGLSQGIYTTIGDACVCTI